MNKQVLCKRCKYKLGEHASFCPKCGYNNNPYLKKRLCFNTVLILESI